MDDLLFPSAPPGNIRPTSSATEEYNCLAWAVWDQRHVIWPDEYEQLSWPPNLPREETVNGIQEFFRAVGFTDCASSTPEANVEKIAIYSKGNTPTHVARQLHSGLWTSKLGSAADVDHKELSDLADQYGQVAVIMKRRFTGRGPPLPRLHPGPPLLISPSGSPLIRP
jgi:hypothetical protein